MRSYTHITGALLLFLSFAYLMNLNNIFLGLFFAGWISIFPDIMDRILGAHRGYGHSIFWLIPFILISFWNVTIAAALVVGTISHAVLDILTTHGCPILYPISKVNFAVLNEKKRIKTGTYQDKTVFITLIFLLIPMFIFTIGGTHFEKFLPGQNFLFPDTSNISGGNHGSGLSNSFRNSPNLNIQIPRPGKNVTENITVKNLGDNETSIIVNDT